MFYTALSSTYGSSPIVLFSANTSLEGGSCKYFQSSIDETLLINPKCAMSSTIWVDLTLPAKLFLNVRQHWGARWVGRLESLFSEEYKLELIVVSNHLYE